MEWVAMLASASTFILVIMCLKVFQTLPHFILTKPFKRALLTSRFYRCSIQDNTGWGTCPKMCRWPTLQMDSPRKHGPAVQWPCCYPGSWLTQEASSKLRISFLTHTSQYSGHQPPVAPQHFSCNLSKWKYIINKKNSLSFQRPMGKT